MIGNEKCEVLDKQNFEPKYRRVYDKYSFFLNIKTKKISNLQKF